MLLGLNQAGVTCSIFPGLPKLYTLHWLLGMLSGEVCVLVTACGERSQTSLLNKTQLFGILALKSCIFSQFLVALWKSSRALASRDVLIVRNGSILHWHDAPCCQDTGSHPARPTGTFLGRRLSFTRQWLFSERQIAPAADAYLQSIIKWLLWGIPSSGHNNRFVVLIIEPVLPSQSLYQLPLRGMVWEGGCPQVVWPSEILVWGKSSYRTVVAQGSLGGQK